MRSKAMSKADILMELKPKLKTAYIEEIHVFTIEDWKKAPEEVTKKLVDRFHPLPVVVRSSSRNEDTKKYSWAGCFYSEIGVDSGDSGKLASAIEKVISSYADRGVAEDNDQIIVQPQTRSVDISGVCFTRGLGTNSPYYVINYDDVSGKTDTVTGGRVGSLVCIHRTLESSAAGRWAKLLKAVKEVEEYFPNVPLDIEFALTTDSKVVIFQARPIAANRNLAVPDQEHIRFLIESMKHKFRRFSRPVPHLGGERTIFTDMSDWNPAEMIGSRPNTLDYALYSSLITDSVWHQARSTLGYKDVFPGDLMVSFGKHPYIDARLSFNSLVPETVPQELCGRLVDFYLDKLQRHPEKQDKVEFEIVWSSFNFSLDRELEELKKYGFSGNDTNILKRSLLELTNGILKGKDELFDRDNDLVKHLNQRRESILSCRDIKDDSPWTLFNLAYNLLENCKKFGVLPFSRLARLAFIGKSILISLRDEGIISLSSYHNFLNSIQTVASAFNEDLAAFQSGEMSEREFFNSYGHLRPGTYDITAPRYDMIRHLFKESKAHKKDKGSVGSGGGSLEEALPLSAGAQAAIGEEERRAIDKAIGLNKLEADSLSLLKFIERALIYREHAKLEFTRTLSEAIEFIAAAGERLGFTREDLRHVDLGTLMKFRNPEYSDIEHARDVISQSRDRHRKEKEWSDSLILSPVIMSEKDFEVVSFYKARPNFITEKVVQGPVLVFDREKFLKIDSLGDRIVLLESADPGFDWIFTKKPMGIITKYGGVASHMAIRCAEFGIPAAIGCGPTIYDNLLRSKIVTIDGAKQVLERVEM